GLHSKLVEAVRRRVHVSSPARTEIERAAELLRIERTRDAGGCLDAFPDRSYRGERPVIQRKSQARLSAVVPDGIEIRALQERGFVSNAATAVRCDDKHIQFVLVLE